MVVLAIDTSHSEGSVALCADDHRDEIILSAGGHLRELTPAVQELLAGARVDLAHVDRIAVVVGPGSFTGLRVGLAFAKGLVAGGDLELVAVGSLHALALTARAHGLVDGANTLLPLIDARKSEVYGALLSNNDSLDEQIAPFAKSPVDAIDLAVADTAVFGSGAQQYRERVVAALGAEVLRDVITRPSATAIAEWATTQTPLSTQEVLDLEPSYIRPTDARPAPLRPTWIRDDSD